MRDIAVILQWAPTLPSSTFARFQIERIEALQQTQQLVKGLTINRRTLTSESLSRVADTCLLYTTAFYKQLSLEYLAPSMVQQISDPCAFCDDLAGAFVTDIMEMFQQSISGTYWFGRPQAPGRDAPIGDSLPPDPPSAYICPDAIEDWAHETHYEPDLSAYQIDAYATSCDFMRHEIDSRTLPIVEGIREELQAKMLQAKLDLARRAADNAEDIRNLAVAVGSPITAASRLERAAIVIEMRQTHNFNTKEFVASANVTLHQFRDWERCKSHKHGGWVDKNIRKAAERFMAAG